MITRVRHRGEQGRGWRWSNIPVPEGHVALFTLGLCLERQRPWPLRLPAGRCIGGALVLSGAVVVLWSTGAAGIVDLAAPAQLVTSGPYRLSRHPMYVGWSLGYVGAALVVATAWPVLLSLPLAAWTLREVRREESSLAGVFGAQYQCYRRSVRLLA
ncbi:MAG: PEMT/PEM2 methyltransferase family protein [Ornithinibacter sp.]